MEQTEQYISLDKKYRPRQIDELIGQPNVVSQVKGIFKSGRIARAYLVYGPFGSGKTSLARILAQCFNCQKFDDKTFRSCGECSSCKAFDDEGVPDNHQSISELNGSEQRGIDDVRKLISVAKYKSVHNFRIYILDEIHQWTAPALQAFLKPLEHPPENTIWFLCTTDPQKLPQTIKDRCQKLKIEALSDVDCAKVVYRAVKKEKIKLHDDEEKAKQICVKIARAAECHPRGSLQILEAVWNHIEGGAKFTDDILDNIISGMEMFNPYQVAENLLVAMYTGNFPTALQIMQGVEDKNYHFFFKHLVNTHVEIIYNFFDRTKGTSLSLKTPDFWKFKKAIAMVSKTVEWFNPSVSSAYKRQSMKNLTQSCEILLDATNKLNTFGAYETKPTAVAAILKCTDMFFESKKAFKSE